jgi:DUF438 domain-containing protein
METFTRYVRDIESQDRQALEHLVGMQLRENQQVTINVVNIDQSVEIPDSSNNTVMLPEWCNVYAGLNDKEIDRLDHATQQRLDLTRFSE